MQNVVCLGKTLASFASVATALADRAEALRFAYAASIGTDRHGAAVDEPSGLIYVADRASHPVQVARAQLVTR